MVEEEYETQYEKVWRNQVVQRFQQNQIIEEFLENLFGAVKECKGIPEDRGRPFDIFQGIGRGKPG